MVALPRWMRFGRRAPRADWMRTFNDPNAWSGVVIGGTRTTASGEAVDDDKAMGLSAYFASLRNGAQDLAKLPRKVRRYRPEGERGTDILPRHPVSALLRQPNPAQTWGVFAQVLQHRAMGWGNGYAEIVRDGAGTPTELWPLHPGHMVPRLEAGVMRYDYHRPGMAAKVTLDARDVLHIRGMGDGIQGYSILRYASETLGLGLAAQRHAAAFFGEGMSKRMVAIAKGPTLSAEGREALRKRIQQDRDKNPVGARKFPILDGFEVELKDVGIPPDEAQFLEQREFTVEDVARWFRMSLAKLQYFKRAQGWSSLDALNTDYAVDFLMPWVTTWEEETRAKLIDEAERDRVFVKFNLNGLMRGDSASRVAYYQSGLQNGWLSPNDVRELEDMDPIEDPAADQYRTQMQMVPLTMPEEAPKPPADAQTITMAPPGGADVEDEGMGHPEMEPGEEMPGKPEEDMPSAMERFERAADSLKPVAEAVARRLVRVEANAATRAMAKHAKDRAAFDAWAAKFYRDHAEAVADALAPVGASLEWAAGAVGVGGVGAGPALLAVVPEYRKAVTASDDEDRRVDALLAVAWSALVGNVKETPRA